MSPSTTIACSPQDSMQEQARLAALHEYGLVDTPSEARFDDLAALAAEICNVPMALVSLVDADRLWFKSHINYPYSSGPRQCSLCDAAIQHEDFFMVEDTQAHPIYQHWELQDSPHSTIRFYAAVPLRNAEGLALGVLCTMAHEPHTLNQSQIKSLQALGRQVLAQMELTLTVRRIQQQAEQIKRLGSSKDRFLSIIAHDLRAAFHGIMAFSEVLDTEFDELDPPAIRKIANYLNYASQSTYNLLENLLKWSMMENGVMPFHPKRIKLETLVDNVVTALHLSALNKGIEIEFWVSPAIEIKADVNMLQSALHNLVSNAIKFTPEGGLITVRGVILGKDAVIEVEDKGVGMTPEQVETLLQVDKIQSTRGTNGENGTGLGLILCKDFIERNGGKLSIISNPGKGSIFRFTLPLYKEDEVTQPESSTLT